MRTCVIARPLSNSRRSLLSRQGQFADVAGTRLIGLGRKLKPETVCILDAFEANRQRITPGIRRRREAGRLDFLAIEPYPYLTHRLAERVAWSNAHLTVRGSVRGMVLLFLPVGFR